MNIIIKLFYFLSLVFGALAIASFGHDAYYYYTHQNEVEPTLSMLGFYLEEYAMIYGEALIDMVGKETWEQYIAPVLAQKSIIVLGVPAVIFVALAAFLDHLASRKKNAWDSKIGGPGMKAKTKRGFEYKRK